MPLGWLARLVRGAAFFFLRRDFQRLEAEIAATRTAFDEALQGQSRAMQEGREHLEIRADDSAAALGDLRQAYIATRTEFEEVRDVRLVGLDAALGRAGEATGAVQREVESLRDARIPQAESAIARFQQALETLQRELESVRDDRDKDIAGLQRALDALQATVAGVQSLAEELRDGRMPALSPGRLTPVGWPKPKSAPHLSSSVIPSPSWPVRKK